MKSKSQSKNHNWQKALSKFLVPWRRRKEVIGAMACGSRIQGTDTVNSDIDVHILLSNQTIWRERGNCIVDGFLIEYFSNPARQLKEYRKDDFEGFTRTDAKMFASGRIIFDKNGDLTKLKKQASKELKNKFRKLSKAEIELGKYLLWDELDNLKDLNTSIFYDYSYILLLRSTLELYRKFLGVEVSASSKLTRYFTSKDFRKRYGISAFPDARFVELFIAAVKNKKFGVLKKLIEHVQKKMGGFEIDGWKLRSKIKFKR